jgi:hypothetical protein
MSFLQPMLLAALPIVALPIVIHLINQRRYQTIRWGAMMFLLAANRMSRGYARLRQWWIMLFRMLAIAGLIFAVSRPLASGRLGLAAGSRTDTTIILLDRSPSMRQQPPRAGVGSKLETGRQQLVRTLNTLSSARWVLIESTANAPYELESPDALLNLPAAEATSASADLPAMVQAARDYIQANKTGRTEIWICSDIRQNDWNADDGRWQSLRDSLLELAQGVRLHLLAYPQSSPDNVCVRVTNVRRRQTNDSSELLVSLRLTRENSDDADAASATLRATIPVRFEIEGARSELMVEMVGPQFELVDHRIPLDRNHQRGWGSVSIPADSNPADNEFYFTFDQPALRQTVVVAEDAAAARPLQLTAAISPDPGLRCSADTIAPEQLSSVDWDKVSLLLWQAPLPTGDSASHIQAFVNRGGCVIFFPPREPTNEAFAGIRWQSWVVPPSGIDPGIGIETWRGDQDLLAHTQSGSALPVGQLTIRRHCGFAGEHTPLAVLKGGASLLGRATTGRTVPGAGGVYFCGTTAAPGDSTLAANGVVLYVLVQRAIATAATGLGNTRQLVAGNPSAANGATGEQSENWRQLAGPPDAISTDFAFHSGVYGAGEKLLAVNRPADEDQAAVLPDHRVAALFHGLDFSRVDDQAGNLAALIHEIWRPFLIAMIAALLAESILCLPRMNSKSAAAAARGELSRAGASS